MNDRLPHVAVGDDSQSQLGTLDVVQAHHVGDAEVLATMPAPRSNMPTKSLQPALGE